MEINPIPENDVGYQSTPDNGLSAEQMAAIDEQVRLSEEVVQNQMAEQSAQPSAEGTAKPEPTPSAEAAAQPEEQQPEPEQQEEGGGFADLPNTIDDNELLSGTAGARLGWSLGFGLTDTASDLLNWGLDQAFRGLPDRPQVPKFNAYDEQWLNATRKLGSLAIPQMGLAGKLKGVAGATAVGSKLNQTRLGRFAVDATTDLAATAAIVETATTSLDDKSNFGNFIQDQTVVPIPAFMDQFIENWAIQPGDSPDKIREKNRSEEYGMGLLGPMLGYLMDAQGTLKAAKPIEIKGTTPLSENWLKTNAPEVADYTDDVVLSAKIRQDQALAEYGDYNFYRNNGDPDVPLRGVDNELFEYQELGVRAVDDFGVVGASVDAAQIAANKGTGYGRIRNMISEGGLKYALDEPTATGDIALGLTKTLKDADQYVATGQGWKIDFNEIIEAGDNLAIDMIDPSMDAKALRELFDPYIVKNDDGVEILRESGYAAVLGATKKMISEYTGMDVLRSQAYLNASLAGQTADIAEGARLNRGGMGVKFAQEKIRDNLKFLLKLKAETNYYKNQKAGLLDAFKRGMAGKTEAQALKDNFPLFQENLTREIADFGRDLDFIYNDYPELGEVISELIEMTDGRSFTISALNETMANSFKNFRPLFDANPDTPNLIGKAFRGNVFNSMLSSVEVPLKALYGNLAGTVFEPFNMMAGAAIRGDVKSMQDYWMAYTSIGDTLKKSMDFGGKMFTKAAQNDPRLQNATDIDFAIKQDRKIDLLRKTAELEDAKGNHGYKVLADLQAELIAMSRHPAMRFSSNSMTGLDGMTQATFANAEARFRAMDLMRQTDGAVDPKELAKIANQEYNKMFDANGILADEAVKYASDEIALRLDNPMAQALRGGSKRFPIVNILFPFPGTQTNIIKQFDDMAPVPYSMFQKDVNELIQHNTEWFANNPIKVRQLLAERGYNVDEMTEASQLATITRLKDHVAGRKATTTILMALGTMGVAHDRLTGDGFYDRQKQQSREQNGNWKARSVRVTNPLNGEDYYVPWKGLLPPGVENWLAGWLTAVDNFDSLGEQNLENLHKKFSFIFGASLADDAGLSVIEPIVQIANGNTAAFARWSAHQLNSAAPLAGTRKDLSDLVDSGLKHVDAEIPQLIKNRNRGTFPGGTDDTQITNPLDGTRPNDYNFLQRLINKVSPVKVHTGPSELGRFLHDIEYPSSMLFRTYQGIKLTASEKAQLQQIAADQGIWTQGVAAAKELADQRGTIATLREAQKKGLTADEIVLEEFDGIHSMIDTVKGQAEEAAINALPGDVRLEIYERIQEKERNKLKSQTGNILVPTR